MFFGSIKRIYKLKWITFNLFYRMLMYSLYLYIICVWFFHNIKRCNGSDYNAERNIITNMNISHLLEMKCTLLALDLDQMFVEKLIIDISPIPIIILKSSDLKRNDHAAKMKDFLSELFCTSILGNLTSETGIKRIRKKKPV